MVLKGFDSLCDRVRHDLRANYRSSNRCDHASDAFDTATESRLTSGTWNPPGHTTTNTASATADHPHRLSTCSERGGHAHGTTKAARYCQPNVLLSATESTLGKTSDATASHGHVATVRERANASRESTGATNGLVNSGHIDDGRKSIVELCQRGGSQGKPGIKRVGHIRAATCLSSTKVLDLLLIRRANMLPTKGGLCPLHLGSIATLCLVHEPV